MPLFDFRPYSFKVELEKPKNDYYKYGDKLKGKIELLVKDEFFAKELAVNLIQETKIETYSTIYKTYDTKFLKDKIFSKDFLQNKDFQRDLDSLPQKYVYDFEYVFEKPIEKDKNLVNKVFDVIYPDKKTYKYFFKAILDFRMKKPEIYEKELIVKEN
jgi:hypothetical protein